MEYRESIAGKHCAGLVGRPVALKVQESIVELGHSGVGLCGQPSLCKRTPYRRSHWGDNIELDRPGSEFRW